MGIKYCGKKDKKRPFSSSQVPDGSIWLEVCCDKISRASQASVMTTSDVQSAFLAEGIQGPLGGLPTRIKKFLHNFELDQKRGPGGHSCSIFWCFGMQALCFLNLSLQILSDLISVARAEISQSDLVISVTTGGALDLGTALIQNPFHDTESNWCNLRQWINPLE